MNFLDDIYQAYLTLNNWLAIQEMQAQTSDITHWSRTSELNNYAFFVLLFGQLEDHINDNYEHLVGPWEDSAFKHRVNCLYDADSAEAELILDYYYLRCDIAHGHAQSGQMGELIHLPEVYQKIVELIAC